MEKSLERFVEDQNIARYTDQLKYENDAVKRNVLLRLLRIEEAMRICTRPEIVPPTSVFQESWPAVPDSHRDSFSAGQDPSQRHRGYPVGSQNVANGQLVHCDLCICNCYRKLCFCCGKMRLTLLDDESVGRFARNAQATGIRNSHLSVFEKGPTLLVRKARTSARWYKAPEKIDCRER